jgi:hypothetical protein
MELNEFITKCLVEIVAGVKNANNELKHTFGGAACFTIVAYERGREQGYISFDIAVTTNEKNDKQGEAGIKLWAANVGGRTGNTTSQENAHRLRFYIIPTQVIA